MLSTVISTSERVAGLSLKAKLLFTWLIAHADDQGRMSAKSSTIKAVVCPMVDEITESEIESLLDEMSGQGLIERYPPYLETQDWYPTSEVLQIIDWWDHQSLRDPQPSKFPPNKGWTQDRANRQSRDSAGRFEHHSDRSPFVRR